MIEGKPKLPNVSLSFFSFRRKPEFKKKMIRKGKTLFYIQVRLIRIFSPAPYQLWSHAKYMHKVKQTHHNFNEQDLLNE